MQISELCQLLLNTDQFGLHYLVVGETEIKVGVESNARSARCPKCQRESTKLHSHYLRYPRDVAGGCRAQGQAVFLPQSSLCQTDLCGDVSGFCHAVCTQDGAGGIQISDTTINRIVRHLPDPPSEPVRVLGVDDWAKRKGQRYGTILVDTLQCRCLERGRVIDLLPDRTGETLLAWLVRHPEIEIVSRDRSQTYAQAIQEGASTAVQVADRWHLLHNTSEALLTPARAVPGRCSNKKKR